MTAARIDTALNITGQEYLPWTPSSSAGSPYLTFSFYENASDLPTWYNNKTVGQGDINGVYPKYDDPGIFIPFTNSPGGEREFVDSTLNNFLAKMINLDFVPVSDAAGSNLTFGTLNYQSGAFSSFGAAIDTDADGDNRYFAYPGDVWLSLLTQQAANADNFNAPKGSGKGDDFNYVLPHEIGHALGLLHSHVDNGPTPIPGFSFSENSQKYTIMSYNVHPAEGLGAWEFQIYDIAALQYLYGRRDEHQPNTYSVFEKIDAPVNPDDGGAFIGTGDDRIFSIWDGGGIDKIDAFYNGESAFIDLRPGHFSSIGPNALRSSGSGIITNANINNDFTVKLDSNYVTLGAENISIAFGAYIENARGADRNDVIIGNMLANHLEGMGGNDLLFADGFAIGLADNVLTKKLNRTATGLVAELHSSFQDADYRQIDTGGIWGVGSEAAGYAFDRSNQTNVLDGGAGNDLLAGSDGKDTLIGGGENDLLIGGKGEDILNGDAGDDVLFGDEDRDKLFGGANQDKLYGGDGNDVLKGEAGIDALYGEDGNDWLEGGDGTDLIEGNDGNDRIDGGKGDDKDFDGGTPGDTSDDISGGLFGGFGDDIFVSELNDGDDDIDGGLNGLDLPIGDGTDTIAYKYAQGDSTIRITSGSSLISSALFGKQSPADFGISITGAQDETGVTGTFGNDTLTSIERASIEAGNGADSLVIDGKSYYGYLNYVDFGDQGSSFENYDEINAIFATTNIIVDLSRATN